VVRDAAFSPGRMITYDIARDIANMGGKQKFLMDLIDPLAEQTQVNTNMTTIEDLNRFFHDFKKEGWGTGANWRAWDTKGNRGFEEMTTRLINSSKVGKPFNNEVVTNGRKEILPTIWFFDRCKQTIDSMRNWRYEEYGTRNAEMTHDPKEKRSQKFSHFPITIESMLKNPFISMARFPNENRVPREPKKYYQGRR
jgi:hypothetical protein